MRTGVLAGAVSIAACLALAACSATGARSATRPPPSGAPPSSSATPAVDPDSVPPCPEWDEPPNYPDGPLPAGAVSLRICAGDNWKNAPGYVPLGPDLVADLLALPRGPWVRQR